MPLSGRRITSRAAFEGNSIPIFASIGPDMDANAIVSPEWSHKCHQDQSLHQISTNQTRIVHWHPPDPDVRSQLPYCVILKDSGLEDVP